MMLLLKHAAVAAFLACLARAQTFEAASVKALDSNGGRFTLKGGPGTDDPGRITYSNVPLRIVMLTAYDVKNYQLTGPDWLNTLRYDIAATIPTGTIKEQFQSMLRHLLESRFGVTSHREAREMAIYELAAGKKGFKIKPVAPKASGDEIARPLAGAGPDGFPKLAMPSAGLVIETKNGSARITGKEVSMAKFAEMLTAQAHRPVFDRTGLDGIFSFELYFTPEGAAAGDNPEPDLFAALEEQLGLRLAAARGPVEYLVIDHADKIPTGN